MSTEEPAWRAELLRAQERYCDEITMFGEIAVPSSTADQVFLEIMEPHIKAAEERGRREALRALGAEIDALAGNIPNLKARDVWKAGYQGALATLSVWVKLDPDRP